MHTSLKNLSVLFLVMTLSCLVQAEEASTLYLSDIIRLSATEAGGVKSEKERLRQSGIDVQKAGSSYWPQLNTVASVGTYSDRQLTEQDSERPETPRLRNQYAFSTQMRYSIIGSTFLSSSNLNWSVSKERLANQVYRDTKRESVSKGVELFFDFSRLSALRKFEQDVIDLKIKQKKDLKSRYNQGRVMVHDVTRLEIEINKQNAVIKSIEAELESTSFELKKFLNLSLVDNVEFDINLERYFSSFFKKGLPDLDESLTKALKFSPGVLRSQYDLESRIAARKVNKGNHLPSFDLILEAASNSDLKNEIGDSNHISYGSKIELNIPLFTGFSSFYDEKYDRSRVIEGEINFANAKRDLLVDLKRKYKTIQISKIDVEEARKAMELTERLINETSVAYKRGRLNLTELLDAYQTDINAKKRFLDGMVEYLVQRIQLSLLVGELDV